MDDSWDNLAATWDDIKEVQQYAHEAFKSLNDVNIGTDVTNILDFGCGTGLLTLKLAEKYPHARIIALDVSSKMISILEAKKMANISTMTNELTMDLISSHPLLKDIKFDLIVASSSLSFVPNYPETIACLCALLKPDSGVLVSWDWEVSEPGQNGLHRPTVEQVFGNLGIPVTVKGSGMGKCLLANTYSMGELGNVIMVVAHL